MSLYQDRQIKGFLLFLTLFALLFVGTATVLTIYQVNDAEVLWLKHDEAVSSSPVSYTHLTLPTNSRV